MSEGALPQVQGVQIKDMTGREGCVDLFKPGILTHGTHTADSHYSDSRIIKILFVLIWLSMQHDRKVQWSDEASMLDGQQERLLLQMNDMQLKLAQGKRELMDPWKQKH